MATEPNTPRQRFDRPLASRSGNRTTGRPKPYPKGLELPVSAARPHVLACDRVLKWTPGVRLLPVDEQGQIIESLAADLARGPEIAAHSVTEDTRATYGAGLLCFHVYCERHGGLRTIPASHETLLGFVSAITGSFTSSTISTYMSAIQFWHEVHNMPWLAKSAVIKRAIKGAADFEPVGSRKPPRPPVTVAMMEAMSAKVDQSSPVMVSTWAAGTTAFFGIARMAELVVKKAKFDPDRHPSRKLLQQTTNREGNVVWTLHIPKTKCNQENGEDLCWAAQPNLACDPVAAMDRHLILNNPGPDDHIFSYPCPITKNWPNGRRPLTFSDFRRTWATIGKAAGVHVASGHSFRIGGTTEYLLRGVEFAAVQSLGRWSGQAFEKYIRDHAEIMAPYLQPNHEAATRLFQRQIPRIHR